MNNETFIIEDDYENEFLFTYGGSDLYWVMYNYKEDNMFSFSEENQFYQFINDLFTKFEVDKKIEWLSEAYGEETEAHKLIIEKIDNNYVIKFIQNKNNMYCLKDLCPICFCLSGSRNPQFAYAISDMYYKIKVLKDNSAKRKLNKCSI